MGRSTRQFCVIALFLAIGVLVLGMAWLAFRSHKRTEYEERRFKLESKALLDLRCFSRAEREFRDRAIVDQDRDGIGEYGWLDELAGWVPVRKRPDGTKPLAKASLCLREGIRASCFRDERFASCGIDGYDYVTLLPVSQTGASDDGILSAKRVLVRRGKGGERFTEWGSWSVPMDPVGDAQAIDLQEEHFVAYAIPNGHAYYWPGVFGRYAYVINEKGEIHYTELTEGEPYKWDPNPDLRYRAAFVDDGTADTYFNNPLADGQKAFDGRVWHKLKTEDQRKPNERRDVPEPSGAK